jgi:hypothetical protein
MILQETILLETIDSVIANINRLTEERKLEKETQLQEDLLKELGLEKLPLKIN